MPGAADLTLQINLCAGDLAYAERTVPALVAAHRPDVAEVVVVADACRPPSSPPDARHRVSAEDFAHRLGRLRQLCASLVSARVVDRLAWLEPDPASLRALNARYAGVPTARSHDHLGHAFSAYFLAWDSARTRYVAHFDADILLWQQPGFHWLPTAVAALERDHTLLGASPRIAPPPATDTMVEVQAEGSGWLPTWPLDRVSGGWRSPWFSTRCHLMDRERLQARLPLTPARGAAADRRAAMIDHWLSPLQRVDAFARFGGVAGALARRLPPFPLPPEVLLHEASQAGGFGCLYLDDPRAWFIHPDTKPPAFTQLLPHMLEAVGQHGDCPAEQRGVSRVQFDAWERHAVRSRGTSVMPQ